MLVVAVSPQDDTVRWSGRRHDDDGPAAVSGDDAGSLFDTVFHALHDGEQVSVGFPAPLGVATDPAVDVVAAARTERPAVRELDTLVVEIGRWRPWTVLCTSLPRWRATTSVLVWETTEPDPAVAVEAFYALVDTGAERGAEDDDGEPIVNVAAALAVQGGLTVDRGQWDEPVVRVSAPGP